MLGEGQAAGDMLGALPGQPGVSVLQGTPRVVGCQQAAGLSPR